ncbi:exonuclease SbcCD subunit D C-terminal domain-containing protein [Sphaerochaeta halotolerans]|uniref:exonuclease SbcCD subunit D C-terminal domain-containing protein n=1 Tax=Sphaerochaeta halotolerans TaxID=2293840 RepID=UPI00136E6AEB|nr:exonuclease SbcCD subunit D C-terminal domain-containing protein [Sphaerochaeta halotolerans]MXI85766.1 exonuclease subunit SbcD [Sphaerochaeta halotolerans]
MNILHTSDWHIGRSLFSQKRYDEFASFLDWLREAIESQHIDILLVSGDVFDTSTPSNRAQQLYYEFLYEVSKSCCRTVVIIGGNHDSPSFLQAPSALLNVLNVKVIGSKRETPEEEIVIAEKDGKPLAIICAVPYLRDKDIRYAEAGETIDDKNRKLLEGIKEHYSTVCDIAKMRQSELGSDIPIIAMGHLFTQGGKTVDGDGVSELYIGSLAHVDSSVFPDYLDYVALGHLHVPQRVGGKETIRYSGSPIPMGFGEAKQQKQVVLLHFEDTLSIEPLFVPSFYHLESIKGTMDQITSRIQFLREKGEAAYLEIEYTAPEMIGDLSEQCEELVQDSNLTILRIRNRQFIQRVMASMQVQETLEDLNPEEVFTRCLDTFAVTEGERQPLRDAYHEILLEMHDEDTFAE